MNKNTRLARRHGFPSMKDMQAGTNKIFKGSCCDTSWDAKTSKHRARKNYHKQQQNKE